MPSIRSGRLLVTVVAIIAVALPASASSHVPVLDEQQVYFRCTETRVSQADLAQSVDWTTAPPTASFTEGGGCGSHDSQLCCAGTISNENYVYDAVFRGTITGNLDTLTVTAWALDWGASRARAAHQVHIFLAVDGKVRLDNVPVTVDLSPTEATRRVEFSVSGLDLLTEKDARRHSVHLVMKTPTYSGSDITWMFDATEVPSGITFNPEELSALELPAAPR